MKVELFEGDLAEFIDLFHESTGLDDRAAVEKLIAIEVTKGTQYGVVRDEGKIVGMIGLYLDPVPGVRDLDPAQVIDLAVHEDYRGKGLSRLLMDWAVDRAWEAGQSWIWLYTGSPGYTVDVYLKLGFEVCGVNENYWGTDGSRVWLRRKIGD